MMPHLISVHRKDLTVFELENALNANPERINELKALPNGIHYTPLQAAADQGNIEVVRYLIGRRVDLNKRNEVGVQANVGLLFNFERVTVAERRYCLNVSQL